MDQDGQPRIEAEGGATMQIREGGSVQEVNAPMRITVDRTCSWTGRPDREPAVSDAPEVKRFVRKAVYAMRPDPAPRPLRPVPKPTGAARKAQPKTPELVACPRCGGAGEVDNARTGRTLECGVCEGAGQVSPRFAQAWIEDQQGQRGHA